MSGSIDDGSRQRRASVSPAARHMLNMMIRMSVELTRGVFWKAVGSALLDGRTKDTTEAENFSGIGFYARPRAGANAECIVAHMGGENAGNPAIIATRDEETRAKVAKELDQDETMMFNNVSVVHCRKTGTVEIRTPNGVALSLPTLAEHNRLVDDHNQLREAFNLFLGHQHQVVIGGPGTFTTTLTTGPGVGAPPPTPQPVEPATPAGVGTSVLKTH